MPWFSAPVLAMPNFSKTLCIETDASNYGVWAVLTQDGHPLAFISKPLGPRTQGLSTYEKEYMAILIAVDQWRSHLQQAEFIIYTDQKSLVYLNEQRLNTPWQKVFTILIVLQYKVVYKKGTDNSAADALSRSHSPAEFLAISSSTPSWLSEVEHSYSSDAFVTATIAQLSIDPTVVSHFSFHNGLLRYKNKIWVGSDSALQQKLITAFHNSPMGGHSDIPVTLRRLKQYFAWKGMNATVHAFVKACTIGLQAKPDRARYPGLLQQLPIPAGAWQLVSLDFVEGLPKSEGMDIILVVVDKFSKYSLS